MKIAAMICGIIGGILSMVIGLAGAGIGEIAKATGDNSAVFYQIIYLSLPIAAIVGAAITQVNALAAGSLLAASAIGLAISFGVSIWTGIPLALIGAAAVLAFVSLNEENAASNT